MLLLDEPAAGVPAAERRDILDTVAALPADVSVLLIEHDMDLVFSFAHAHHRAGQRRGADRRHAGRDRRRPAVRAVYLGDDARWPAWLSRCSRSSGLTCGYGEAVVLSDVSFTLDAGRSLALLGRNGTGKTTLIDTLVGVTRRHAGRIVLAGREIHALPVHRARRRPASAGCRRSATSSSR